MRAVVEWSPRAANQEADEPANSVRGTSNLEHRLEGDSQTFTWDLLPQGLVLGRIAEDSYQEAKSRGNLPSRCTKALQHVALARVPGFVCWLLSHHSALSRLWFSPQEPNGWWTRYGRPNGGSCIPTTAGSTTIAVMESRAHMPGIGTAPGVALTTATRYNTCTHCKVDWGDASQSSSQYPEEGHPALQGEAKQGHTKMK